MAMKTVLKQREKNAQRNPGEKGWACYCWGKEGHLKRDCPQAPKPPPAPCQSAKDHPRGETAHRGVGFGGWTLKTTRTEGAWGPQTSSHPNYTQGTPGIDNWGPLFLPPSDVYVRSFLYLFYTLMKLYYTKSLSDQALSLAMD